MVVLECGLGMIPEKIQLRNFMSYRDTVPLLDFSGIHVACLSGENGAGKSALLDAITWALWGRARVTSDDELITQGEQEMEVDFQFFLNGGRYRVLRRRSSAKRGQTVLDLQIQEQSGWRSISGNTVRETQALIIELLRMQYDTFINSAFLVQGKADEFTRKTPAERKQVLAEILSLAEYERLEDKAKEQARRINEEVQGKEALIGEYRRQVERREFFISEELSTRARADELTAKQLAAQQELAANTERVRQLEALRAERDRERARAQQLQQDVAETSAELQGLQHDIAIAHAIVARQAEIEHGASQLSVAKAELQRLDGLYEQAITIRDQKRDIEEQIRAAELQLQMQLQQTEAEMQRLETLIKQRPELEQEQEQLKQRLASFDQLAVDLSAARTRRDQLEAQSHTLSQLLVREQHVLGRINVAKDSLIAAREEQSRRVADYDALLRNEERWREELATATAQQRALARDERRLAELRTQDQTNTQRLGELQAKTATLKDQGDQINEKLAWLSHSGDTTCPLCQSEIGHSGIEAIQQSYISERQQLRDAYRDSDTEAKALARDIDSRRREMYGLERKLDELKTITARVARLENDLRDAEEQRARRAEAEASLLTLQDQLERDDFAHPERAELAELQRDIAAMGIDSAALDAERKQVSRQIDELERDLAARSQIAARMSVVEQQLAQISAAAAELAQQHEQALSLKVKLDGADYAAAERQQIAQLTQQMQDLGYGRNAHQQARDAVVELEHWAEEAQRLREAQSHLATNERHAVRLQQLIERNQAELATLTEHLTALSAEVAELPAAANTAEQARRSLDELSRRLAVAQQEWGAAQEKVLQIEQIAEQLQVQEAELTTLTEEREVYQELVRAFGKKGIQAMLIETAIPELEREANELLGRMTDNQMHLRFETLRETKKGDTNETLDIHISDEQGTRRYDLYSGGEAFRINFAIRIALSKMLARRAGANLQTLIIDEGFGSQDGRGRERLVEAINHIQDDFVRILVITHIQELKDQFPVQIEITKTEAGSRWALH